MDQIISELIAQWGTFGLVVALVAYIIYDNLFRRKKANDITNFNCQKGDIIKQSLTDIKELVIEKMDHIYDNVDHVSTDILEIDSKVNLINEKFETKINSLERQISEIPARNTEIYDEQLAVKKKKHDKQMDDLFKLGPKLHKIMALYNERIGADHIFLGSFHNGNSSLSGIPYYKFDIIAEKFKPNKVDRDCEFAHMYKDADILRYDALPISLVQNGTLHFVIDEQRKSELSKYDDIVYRRMIGRDIKQIALCLLRDVNNKPSGFIGCVSYNYDELKINELENCGKELEIIYHASEKNNNI